MKQTIQNLWKSETFLAVLLILLATLLTHAVNIPRFGYYYDDWYLLWSGQARGAASIIPLFSTDRPFMGVVYSFVYRLLGDAMLNWHLYALLWRLIGGLAFFWIARLLWPQQRYLTTLMTVLFIAYPGFLSEPDANTKQNHLYGFGTALLSIALTLQALRVKAGVWKIVCVLVSVLLAINYLFIYEYMIGLEGMRLALLGYALYQDGFTNLRSLAKEALKKYWPYFLTCAGFLYWRLFIFESTRNATNPARLAGDYLSDLRHMAARLVLETGKDFLDTTIFAWFVKPYQAFSGAEYADLSRAALLAAVVTGLVLVYLFLLRKRRPADEDANDASRQPLRAFLGLGAFTVLCAVAPVVASGRDVDLGDAYKSYGLHPVGGVVIFVAGLALLLQPQFRRLALVALVALSVATQALNADYWARFWNYERQAWWQLSWRAPDIRDDTLLMVYMPDGYRLQQDYEAWGPANLIYRPGPAASPAIQAEVLNQDTAYDILKGSALFNHMRDIPMNRDYNNLLLLTIPSAVSCLHVIDGALPVYSESEDLLVQKVGGYSRLERIVPDGASPAPSARIFGAEPAHGWCHAYQQASLARQRGDWQAIGALYDRARAQNLEPGDPSEWLPFFEGLVNAGRQDEAKVLFNKEIKGRAGLRLPLCASLSKDPGYPPGFGYDYDSIHAILCNS